MREVRRTLRLHAPCKPGQLRLAPVRSAYLGDPVGSPWFNLLRRGYVPTLTHFVMNGVRVKTREHLPRAGRHVGLAMVLAHERRHGGLRGATTSQS